MALDSTTNPNGRAKKLLERAIDSFTITERMVFWLATIIFVASSLYLLWQLNQNFLVEVPERGGKITEGIIGTPRFINPALVSSDADRDLTTLVYSGLLRATPDGELVNNLSKEYSVSEDGLVYTFILRDDIFFHDGERITSEDVKFTINAIKDPAVKSPRRIAWDGVTVETNGESEVRFILKQAYAPFLQNATIGILPKHIWEGITPDEFSFSQLNIDPVGSGPYYVDSIKRNDLGLPISYVLKSWKYYPLGKPFVDQITIKFYSNEQNAIEAYEQSDIQSLSGVSPKEVERVHLDDSQIEKATLPRVFGVFFNQNQASVFINKEVRQALNIAVDRDQIVKDVLSGFAVAATGPVPDVESGTSAISNSTSTRAEQAISILTKAGWTINDTTGKMEKKTKTETIPLKFSLSTGGTQELIKAAQEIAAQWTLIGADVDVKIFETGDLNQNIIRPRKYDALFFGEVIGRDLDLYPFWHSSQRNDPGLNIALYTNAKVDSIVEALRQDTNPETRRQKIQEFTNILSEDVPGVFVYSPEFIYIVPDNIHNLKIGKLNNSSERFLNVHEWYIDTNQVWKIFTR